MSPEGTGDRNKRVGAIIKKRRQFLGWEQQDLAKRVGVHVNSVQKWERGEHFPGRKLGKLEAVLSISLTEEPEPEDILPGSLRQSIQDEYRDRPDIAAAVIEAVEATLSGRPLPPTRRRASGR